MDVFEKEPIDPDNPLLKMGDKVLATPHMAANNNGAGLGPGIVWGTLDVLHALRGEDPEARVQPRGTPPLARALRRPPGHLTGSRACRIL